MGLKKKLFWIAHEGEKSGANNALLAFASALKDKYDITVIVPSSGAMWRESERIGVNVKLFHYYSVMYSGNGWAMLLWLRKRLRNFVTFFQAFFFLLRNRPNIIITNSIVSPPLFAVLAFLLRIKHIWYLQEFGNKDHGILFDWGYNFTLRYINMLSANIIAVSAAVKEHVSYRISKSKIKVVFNCVEVPEHYLGSGPGVKGRPFRILHIAQIAPGKNQLDGIRAVKILIDKGFDVVLEIAGDILNTDYKKKLDEYIAANKLENKVFFSGFTQKPFEKISQAHTVLLCSRSEACALTIFETLQIGTPIIVSNTGGNVEIIKHQETGLVYRYQDAEDLANKISSLYLDDLLGGTISANAKTYTLTHYRLSKSAEQIAAVIENN